MSDPTVSTAVILAGGLGSRLRSEVPDLPKPMAPIAGQPFLRHQMTYWIGQGIERFVLSVGYRHEAIVDYFGSRFQSARIQYAIESTPLGTGGGLVTALQYIDPGPPLLVLNGDTYFAVDLDELHRFAIERSAHWCFALFRTSETGRYMGMDIGPDGRILSLAEQPSGRGSLANGGVYLVDPSSLLDRYRPGERLSLENDILADALASGDRLYGREFHGKFIDIGVPEDFRRAGTYITASTGGPS